MGRSMEVSDAHQQAATASSPLEEFSSGCPNVQQQQQQRAKPQPEQSLKCPRCQSTNTKFCYYNNYSLSQPRYFCKGCRRYWTKGGSLRNVPVGGGYRRNKKPSSYSSNSKRTTLPLPFITNSNPPPPPPPPPLLPYDPNDLNLALASLHKQQHNYHENHFLLGNPTPELSCNHGFLDIFRTGSLDDNIFCGYGEEGPLFLPSTPTTATTVTTSPQMESCKDSDREDKMLMVDLQWQDNNGGDCILALDSAGTRDQYWTSNGVPSTWHGLINSGSLV